MEIKMEMKDLELHGEDQHGFDVFSSHQEEVIVGKEDEEIWFETASQHHQNNHNYGSNNAMNNINNNENGVLDVDVCDPSSLFYAEFPALPDFPCMSSSSSSSSTPAPTKPCMMNSKATSSSASTASSGTASWAVLKSDAEHDPSTSTAVSMDNIVHQCNTNSQESVGGQGGNGFVLDDVDQCMDMMQNFGCIDLLEGSDLCWDPSPLFEDEDMNVHVLGPDQMLQQQQQQQLQQLEHNQEEEEENVFQQFMLQTESGITNTTAGQSSGGGGAHQQQESSSADDLAMMFFEWLKSNKETISAEDLRNIKIKKSTIESAAKRLGGGKEGMKQLLKLILQWVQNHHLQTNPSDAHTFNPATWLASSPPPFIQDPTAAKMVQSAPPPQPPQSGFTHMVGYMGADPYAGAPAAAYPPQPLLPSDYQSWAPPAASMQYGVGPYGPFPDPGFGGYASAYPAGFYYHPGPGEGLVRMGSSATKEARKKRMARQRRFITHHHRSHHHNHSSNLSISQPNQMVEQHVAIGNGSCGVAPHPGHGNWVYWQHPSPQSVPPQAMHSVPTSGLVAGQMMPPALPSERSGSGISRQVGIEKKQGWKTEKNLRFLLQKVLKQSDVGNLGRIVLPKKEAEMHLPELEARDGIPIAMEDIGTSRVWNMRYRFWPNNKSRMYLLENTGDFVRSNGLQEGDFIVIYSDVKCGKYMIRGVKVRPQQAGKLETANKNNNKSNKTQKTQGSSSPAGNGLCYSPSIMHS